MSKYRPPQPILTLVVPQLKNDGFKWRLEGRDTARRCLIQRGLLPVLAAPSQGGARALPGFGGQLSAVHGSRYLVPKRHRRSKASVACVLALCT